MFSSNLMNSIGVDFKLKNIIVENKKVKLQIWDTAGQERFRTITTSYYKGAQAIIIVYDVTDKDSFDHLKNWMNDIDKFAKEGVMKVLVGNKSDLEQKRAVSVEQGKEFAKKYNIEFIETSAKDAFNINDLFLTTTKSFISKQIVRPSSNSTVSFTGDGVMINSTNKQKKKESGCC
jgi:Ras-related protein Rab-1A